MPKEWDILLAVLLQNEKVKDTREGLQQITDSLLSLLPHLSSPQRRALLLSYSTILAKEEGEESVEELCTLLNVLQENEEEASLLWTALQTLLSSKEEIKEEMFAWLRALPRLYKIMPFCKSLTCLIMSNCFQESRQRHGSENSSTA